MSNEISGRLNFPRRAVTCYYTAMTMREWNRFADEMEAAIMRERPVLRDPYTEGRRRHHHPRGKQEEALRDGFFRPRGEHHGRHGLKP